MPDVTPPTLAPRTNDLAVKLANVNGTGSASANALLMQAIFRMGIPVAGKNLFPSNIQGLPTWYEIRVNANGHLARAPAFDVVVAMNPETYARDARELRPGGYLLYDSTWPAPEALRRPDVHLLGVPLAAMCREAFAGDRERILMKNIAYAGVLVALLDIELPVVEQLLDEKYARKAALRDSNRRALHMGLEYARAHLPCPLPVRLARMDANRDAVLVDGNTAAALGAIYAGATVAAWYPITPATSLMDAFAAFCKRFRTDPDGRKRYAFLQAEDELAAIGMVIGASWAGARAFTATAGPGISLMSELVGLAYYAEIPAVIVDVQRVGPSTGMPTRTQQADILACAYASHGDTKHILLFPAHPGECFEMMVQAFDLADTFQTPVFMLSDLDVGMNDWVCPRFRWDDAYRPRRGRILGKTELDALPRFFRYSPADENEVAARTLPGVDARGAFFTRGSGHDEFGAYTEDPVAYTKVMERLARKHRAARKHVPTPVVELDPTGPSPLGLVTVGSCDAACREALAMLRERGVRADYMRIRAFPFTDEVEAFLEAHPRNVLVEQNRDGQLRRLLLDETAVGRDRIVSVLEYGGYPLTAQQVLAGVERVL
ncbi:MAG: 2-oxoacid:acceptor oxidoreductase subunit alpha [Myxococcota bacterium]|nr:2-oxoacid:acceptor oxidoreductase subunit alpha [Myxococcota bacterium]MDW8363015.1 2-oxoacid:acceptor oxidoreductase subunit alpha [Myxococcales bacterium]